MNWIDLLLVSILLLAVWSGWHKGFIAGLLELLILAGSIGAAFIFYPYLARFLQKLIPAVGVWTFPLSFIVSMIFARIFLTALLHRVFREIPGQSHQHVANRYLGVVPGLIIGLINATILAAVLLSMPLTESLSAQTRESKLADKLTIPAEWVETKLSPVFDEAVKKTMNKLIVEPKSDETVTLPFTVAHPKIREDLEAKMLVLVNEERAKEGLQLLKADTLLAKVARGHSGDMFARGYFAHNTPEGKDPFDRMHADGVKFLIAGENLALAQNLNIAHYGLMHSPGHRANILRPGFGHIGIGVLDGGFYGLMISQEFRN